jgi:serine/threonine-protein kinase PknG
VLFEAPIVSGGDLGWENLPALKVDPGDRMTPWLAALSVSDPGDRIQALHNAPEETVEVHLETARTALHADRFDVVDAALARVLADDPWEWRAVWLQGLAALAKNDAVAARAAFNAVYGQVPGELAPKLALALTCEVSGEADVAQSLYTTCARTDVNYTAPAAFGLARIRRARGDLDGALAALDLVPTTSRAYVEARRQRAGLLAGSNRGLDSLAAAMQSIERVTIDPLDRARLTANVLDVALRRVLKDGADDKLVIAGRTATEPHLRDGLESAYRQLAQMTDDDEERVRLVDQANRVRRWTLR